MNLLRGLRLNCFLAALLPCLLAGVVLAYQGQQYQKNLRASYAKEAGHSLQSYALLLLDVSQREQLINAISNADERWNTLAIINLNKSEDSFALEIHMLKGSKTSLESDNPHPSLINSQLEAQHWSLESALMAVACPLRSDSQELGVLYGEMRVPAAPDSIGILTLAVSALGIGLLMAMYLSRRIYKPIEYLCDEAEAAIKGNASTAAIRHSTETAHVASSINDLLAQFQARQTPFSESTLESTDSQTDE